MGSLIENTNKFTKNQNPRIFGNMIHLIFQKLLDTKSDNKALIDRIIRQAIDTESLELFSQLEHDELKGNLLFDY